MLDQSLADISRSLQQKKISSQELVKLAYSQIERYQNQLNCFITVVPREIALRQAARADKRRSPADSSLSGLPYVLKDCYLTQGILTTCASAVLANYQPQYSATVYRKLQAAGAILVGKMNMDAWGHGASNDNTDYQPAHNPWDLSRSPGGSSGGPASAVAARLVPFAIAEDTGGSMRNPAAWCNVTSLKVTYGRVSRYGCIAYASSFDTVGPMAKTAADCAYVLEAIAGQDRYDATSSPQPVPQYSALLKATTRAVIGVPTEFFGAGLDPEIKSAITRAAHQFALLGCQIKPVSFPIFDYGVALYYLISRSETSSNLARYDGVRYGTSRQLFSRETKQRIVVGTYALSSGYYDQYYRKAQRARTRLISLYHKIFQKCDAVLSPVTPTHPPKIGELINDPVKNYLADTYTGLLNPAGLPALSLPCGFSRAKLPIGMQLVGPMFSEARLLSLGSLYQQATRWHQERPPLIN